MSHDEPGQISDKPVPVAVIFDCYADIAYLFCTAEEADRWLAGRTREPGRYATTINVCWGDEGSVDHPSPV
jgi:hypothetical protein